METATEGKLAYLTFDLRSGQFTLGPRVQYQTTETQLRNGIYRDIARLNLFPLAMATRPQFPTDQRRINVEIWRHVSTFPDVSNATNAVRRLTIITLRVIFFCSTGKRRVGGENWLEVLDQQRRSFCSLVCRFLPFHFNCASKGSSLGVSSRHKVESRL